MRPLGIKKALVLAMVLGLCACVSGGRPETHLLSKDSNVKVCRVAVLPFVNETLEKGAGTLMYRVFTNELVASGLCDVVSEGDVRQFMLLYRQLPQDLASTPTDLMEKMAKQLDVDAVVRGRIIRNGMESSGVDTRIPYVSLQLEMVSVPSGARLVNTFHQRKGDDFRKALHFGVVQTQTGLFARVAEEVVTDWRREGVFSCP